MYVDPGLRFGIVTATSAASTVRAADHSSGYSLYSMTAPAGAATEIVADVSVHVFHSGFGSAVMSGFARSAEERETAAPAPRPSRMLVKTSTLHDTARSL